MRNHDLFLSLDQGFLAITAKWLNIFFWMSNVESIVGFLAVYFSLKQKRIDLSMKLMIGGTLRKLYSLMFFRNEIDT